MVNILQSSLMVNFLYPMLLIFFISFGVLEKTGIFGTGKTQLNAMVSLVVALIFVSAVFPKIMVSNLVQFLSVGLAIIFVGIMLWGFVSGQAGADVFKGLNSKFIGGLIGISLFFGVLWAAGIGGSFLSGLERLFSFLFDSPWSGEFWTNAIFIGVVAIVIYILIKGGSGGSGGESEGD